MEYKMGLCTGEDLGLSMALAHARDKAKDANSKTDDLEVRVKQLEDKIDKIEKMLALFT